ncbi:hypothetical protein [Nocardia sp. NPDC057440]|uniref:hypothetical protein n=1 Tax=Nocardia sp. NPDC057440 TaxID=3346134 RepID=UPI00366E040E
MTGLDILIIGRSRRTVDTATEQLRSLGFTAHGVIADDEAVTLLDAREVTTLLIGGGVQRESRALLKQRAQQRGVTVLEARRAGREIDVYLREEVVPLLRGRQ